MGGEVPGDPAAVSADWIDLLDVSAAQGAIDWSRVAAAMVAPGLARRFRGAYVKVAEGPTAKDPCRAANIAGLRAAGLPWGAYLYVHPMHDMADQVQNSLDAIGDTMPDFPLALDVEAADPSLSAGNLVDQIRCGIDATIERFGRPPMIYSYPAFWARRVMPAAASVPEIASLKLWWASYGAGVAWYPRRDQLPTAPEPWRTAGKVPTLWQYSGDLKKSASAWTAHVDGINGDVDRSVFTGTEDEFLYDFCGRPRPEQLEDGSRIVHPSDLLP